MDLNSINRLHGVVLLAVLAITACGSSATIVRRDGSVVEGTIRRSTHDELIVKNWGVAESVIPRAEIAAIDHPGNAVAVAGLFLVAYGALNIAVGSEKCSEMGEAYCVGVFAPAVAGASMVFYGIVVWGESNAAAQDPSLRKPQSSTVVVAPLAAHDGERTYGGVGLVADF